MVDNIEALERLSRLRADGTLSDSEFQVQKDRLLANDLPLQSKSFGERWKLGRAQTRPFRRFMRWFFGLQALAVLLLGAFFLLGGPSVINTAKQSVVTAGNLGASDGPKAEYLHLCVIAPMAPGGFRLQTLVSKLETLGQRMQWERAGEDWILRASIHDQLANRDHVVAYQFTRQDQSPAPTYCGGYAGGVMLSRWVVDDEEVPVTAIGSTMQSALQPILGADLKPASEATSEARFVQSPSRSPEANIAAASKAGPGSATRAYKGDADREGSFEEGAAMGVFKPSKP